jgi:hypothetical protein
MDHVETEEEGDMQATLLDGEVLHPIHLFRVCQPEDGTDSPVSDVIV